MSLNERLKRPGGTTLPGIADAPEPATGADLEAYNRMKATLHERMIERLDLATLNRLAPEQLKQEIGKSLTHLVEESNLPLNRQERHRMVQELIDEMLGLGPLEPLLADDSVADILVNGFAKVYVERRGKLELTTLRFRDNEHLMQTILRIVSRMGRRIDESSPMVDARLADGSRVNAIIPPLAVDGPTLSIRRFGTQPLRIDDMLELESLTAGMRHFLEGCVKARLNILISGGTGTGKTTLLNALSSFIGEEERVITIEDAAELQLQKPHVVRLETRPANVEGRGEIVTRDLVRNSLRMRPDRIIVGEIRSVEVFDMLQAMNTGHEGSMATVHSNSPRDALSRVVAMVSMAGIPMAEALMCQTIARALDVIVQLHRAPDGRRRIVSISEVTGTEGSVIQLQEIFRFRQREIDAAGRLHGDFVMTGIRPRCLERIERAGHAPAARLFDALQEERPSRAVAMP